MIFHGARIGVNMFDGSVKWFSDKHEAAKVEHGELKKFIQADLDKMRARSAAPAPLPYRISLVETETTPKSRRVGR